MKELVLSVIRALVDHPEEIRLTSISGAVTQVFELRCHSEDIGKVIGKEGKTVGSLRTLLNAVASKQGRRAVLEVVE